MRIREGEREIKEKASERVGESVGDGKSSSSRVNARGLTVGPC